MTLHFADHGPPRAPALVLLHGLGMDMRIWDEVIPRLPPALRIIRVDLRGHGTSFCPDPPYKMGALVRDVENLLDTLELRDCALLGLALGGMVAQGLAVKRMDMVRGLILSNTCARAGQPDAWHTRARAVQEGGMGVIVDEVLARWFAKGVETSPWRAMLLEQNPEGYAGCCAAIAGTDFYTPTSGLRLPTLGIAGTEDRAIPPDLVRETVNLIPGARMELIRHAGHVPCVEQPIAYATILSDFLEEIGHI